MHMTMVVAHDWRVYPLFLLQVIENSRLIPDSVLVDRLTIAVQVIHRDMLPEHIALVLGKS